MKNKIVITVVFVCLLFHIISNLRTNNVLKEFCSLPVDSFTAIAMVVDGQEYVVEKGTTDYMIIESLYIDLLASRQEGTPTFEKGELHPGIGDIIFHKNKDDYYKINYSYIGSLNAIYIRLSNEKELSPIIKRYFIDITKVDNFFNAFEKLKTQSN